MRITIYRFIFILFVAPTVELLYTPPFKILKNVDLMEEKLIHTMLDNCTENKWYTRTYLKRFIDKGTKKFNKLKLYQYVDGKEILHHVEDAHANISKSPNFDLKDPVLVFVPGFMYKMYTKIQISTMNDMKNDLKVNLFMFDHTSVTSNLIDNVPFNIEFSGQTLGDTLSRFYTNGMRNFRCIGYGIGAHICGFAGKIFKENTNKTLDRISALDPAGACFFNKPPEQRLDKSDANFVDVIHTNYNRYGIDVHLGHVNFYPNGGVNMLGCISELCSHLIALSYYIESFNSKNFLAVKCADYQTFKTGKCANNDKTVMGYWTPTDISHGDYFLFVRSTPKYALGEQGIAKPGFNIRKLL